MAILSDILSVLFFVVAYLGVYYIAVNLYLTWRFFRIKYGATIRPDAKRAILITGATSGFGLTVSKHFYKMGFTVIATYLNDKESGYKELMDVNSSASKNETNGSESSNKAHLFLIPMDVRSQESIVASSLEVDSILENNNIKLYSIINNAGISRDGPVEWSRPEALRDVIDTNYIGTVMITRHFVKRIIENKGRVINVSSSIHRLPGLGISIYGSTKSGISHFTECLNEDLRDYGVKCICLYPGNFLASSNIIYSRIKCIQESINSLSEIERILYKKSIDSYSKSMYGLLKLRLKFGNDDPEEVGRIYKIHIPENLLQSRGENVRKRPKTGQNKNWMLKMTSMLDGSARGKTIEESGLIESYEKAVTLKDPPEKFYPGNHYFSYYSGPILEFLPPVFSRNLGSWLMRAMIFG